MIYLSFVLRWGYTFCTFFRSFQYCSIHIANKISVVGIPIFGIYLILLFFCERLIRSSFLWIFNI